MSLANGHLTGKCGKCQATTRHVVWRLLPRASAQCSKSLLRTPRVCGKGASRGGRAAVHGYTDAVLGSQRDGGMRLDGMTGYEVKMELLLNHGE